MTFEELKSEAAKLPAEDKLQLLNSLQDDSAVEEAWLKAEIMIGVEEMERGECTKFCNEEELNAFFDRIKERALAGLEAEAQSGRS